MRSVVIGAACLALAGCATLGLGGGRSAMTLSPADSATRLITGGDVSVARETHGGGQGEDPLVVLTLRFTDGRTLVFEEANHAPDDVRAQAAGGPLAQAMRLFDETARPTLYHLREPSSSAPICGPSGPANLGLYEAPDGAVSMVGLREGFQFETREDGSSVAAPVSPEIVCSRLSFRRAG